MTNTPYSVELSITPCGMGGSQLYDLTLTDHQFKGWVAGGSEPLDFADTETRDFLRDFLRGDAVLGSQGLAFGRKLASLLFSPERLGADWKIVNARRGGHPLRLELVLPADMEIAGNVAPMVALDDIPFELLADPGAAGFWFRRPGWSLVRTFEGLRATAYQLPQRGRALLAWANPLVEREDGTAARLPTALFDDHEAVFTREVTALGLDPRTTLRGATMETLGSCLRERPETPLLSLIAHGQAGGGTVLLHAGEDSDEGVELEARALAKVCRDGGVKVVLLWSCHGAKRHTRRSSIAAALLEPDVGDVAAVIASHAALIADRTVRFVSPLLRSLRDVASGDLERAVTEARHALGEDDLQWAAPVYYARPYLGRSVGLEESLNQPQVIEVTIPGHEVEGVPRSKPWFRGRQTEIARSLALLGAHRLVTFDGMPGTGKTALAVEVSQRALSESVAGVDRAVWLDLSTRASAEALRESLGILFSLDPLLCKSDLALAKSLTKTHALLVFDNSEDILQRDGDGFRALIDTLLRYTSHIRVLVTSRHTIGALEGADEQVFPVGRLSKGTDREVFLAVAGERLGDEQADPATLDALITALDGHPLSLVLVAGQVGRGLTLRELLVRVQAEDAGVVQDAKLLVQDIEGTPDSRLRANRLVNSLNLSFRPLVKHTPRAAEIFAWLGTLPAGLPGVLVEAVFGDGAKRYSGRLLSLNMAELLGPDDRLILPGPVRWYARMQQGADLDAVPIIPPSRQDELVERSITAIATWLSASKAKLGRGGSTTACERAAAEGANLIALSSKVSGAPPKVLASMADAFAAYARLATHGAFQGTAVIVGEHVRTAMHLGESPSAIATASEALGDLYLRTDRLTEAEHAYGEALKIYRSIEAGIGEANTLRSMGDLYMRTDRTAKAEHVYKEALLLFQKIKYRLGEANTLLTLGDLYVRTSRLQDAERSYNDGALPLFREIEEKLGEANTLRALGDLYARTNRLKSEHLYNEALLIFQEIEEQVGKANTLQALGDLYMLKNRLSDAERMYNEALPIYRAFKDRIGEANTLKELGDVYARTNRVAAAENLYKESLSIHREIADRLGLANALHALGHLYTDSNRLTEAEHSFGEALPIYQAIEQKVGEATTLQGFGYLELKRNAPSSAFQYCLRALAIQNTVNDRLGIGGTHGLLARAASLANRSERAIVLGCRAFALLKQADDDMGQAIAAVDLVLALQEVQDGGFGAVMLLAWVLTSRISHPLADHFELIIRQHGIDPDTIATDAVHAQALTMLQTIEKRYEQILRERNEDPYSPLEPK